MTPPSSATFVIPIVAGIGNALMAEPMVRQLRAAKKDAIVRVVAATNAMAEPFRRVRGVDVTVAGKGAVSLFGAIRAAGPIDCLIVPFPSNRWQYNVMAWRSGAARVVMHSYPAANRAFLSSVGDRVEAKRGLHDVVQNLRLLEPIGVKPNLDDAPRFELTREDSDAANDVLRKAGVDDGKPYIAVHAGSAKTILSAAKRWPVENYALLIGELMREAKLRVVLLEGPDERGTGSEITFKFQSGAEASGLTVVSLSGSLGIGASILQRAKLYVGTDSGLAHLAAAVGTRAVTLFAPADPDRVCPFGNRELVVKPAKACSPCFMYPWESTRPKMRCCEPYCINEISVEMVMVKVRGALAESRSDGKK